MRIRWFRLLKWSLVLLLLGVVVLNVVLYNHAYYFTHFVDKDIPRMSSKSLQRQAWRQRLKLGFFGVEIPKSRNKITPTAPYQSVRILGAPALDAWWIETQRPVRGIALHFHGYTSKKASQLNNARALRAMGYHTMLVDFRGHGDSEGLQTTIGYHEADDVRRAYEHATRRYPDLPVVLMGSSMGAVSILKAVHDHDLKAEALILECPFESLRAAICRRFENLDLPTTLLPDVLLFWGGWQNDMDAFEHNSVRYAQAVEVPTLLLHGNRDQRVDQAEVSAILQGLQGPRSMVVLEAGHDHMISSDQEGWTRAVWSFLEERR